MVKFPVKDADQNAWPVLATKVLPTDSRGGLLETNEQGTELHRDSRHGEAQQQPTFLGKTEFLVASGQSASSAS
jgi:hypothetical protein